LKPPIDSGLDGEACVVGHFLTLVPGHAFTQELGKMLHLLAQQNRDAFRGPVIGNPHEHGEPAGTLDQRGDLRLAALAHNEVTLPESGNRAVDSLGWALADVDHVSDLSPGHCRS
jgi:hypothetical protein